MKIARLTADKVHGYLPLDVAFDEDLTFLTGLNGSGKTSALRLLMALLAPNLEELGVMSFASAAITIRDGDREVVISAERTAEWTALSISTVSQALRMGTAELVALATARRRDEALSPILDKYQQHKVYQAITDLATPMFLGLDRRFYTPGFAADEILDARRRNYMSRRYWPGHIDSKGTASAALLEVNDLVVSKLQEVRASQEELDDILRARFFAKAFEYKPSDMTKRPVRLPSRSEIDKYREQLGNIERAAEGVKIPVPEIQQALSDFFAQMSAVVDALEKSAGIQTPARKKTAKKTSSRGKGHSLGMEADFVEWMINKPQADRVLEHLRLLDDYIKKRTALRDPIERFLSLVNSFFAQTGKRVSVATSGQLNVSIGTNGDLRPTTALSSGERQMLVMLAHLSLNPSLVGSGIFIVDEPELSLHIDWQEKFVDAVVEANPDVQLVLATHSPAIILDRVGNCRVLKGVSVDSLAPAR